MNAITNAYNYYMTTYAPNKSKFNNRTHKQSELKEVYNSILKMNKEAPTYLYDRSNSVYKYAISIKEEAMDLKDALTALTNKNDPGSIIGRKIADSSNSDIVDVSFINNNGDNNVDTNLQHNIEVSNLAKQQVNTGNYLNQDELGLLPNDYSFELKIMNSAYEFQFHISPNDTNKSIQMRLSNLINNSDIGIKAEVLTDDKNRSALEISSENTGKTSDSTITTIFSIGKADDKNIDDVVKYLGLNNISQFPDNARYTIDGKSYFSQTNNFNFNNIFNITLKDTTEEDSPVQIGFKTDIETITENIKTLIDEYNSMITTSGQYTINNRVQTHSLFKDLNSITYQHHNALESIGLTPDNNNGLISVENNLLYQALEEDTEDTVQTIFNFKNALINKTDHVLLNPMDYVNRTIVTYKNPGKTFFNPYITSNYSGMLFNSYC